MTNGHRAGDWVKSEMVTEVIPKIQSYTVHCSQIQNEQAHSDWQFSLKIYTENQVTNTLPLYKGSKNQI